MFPYSALFGSTVDAWFVSLRVCSSTTAWSRRAENCGAPAVDVDKWSMSVLCFLVVGPPGQSCLHACVQDKSFRPEVLKTVESHSCTSRIRLPCPLFSTGALGYRQFKRSGDAGAVLAVTSLWTRSDKFGRLAKSGSASERVHRADLWTFPAAGTGTHSASCAGCGPVWQAWWRR